MNKQKQPLVLWFKTIFCSLVLIYQFFFIFLDKSIQPGQVLSSCKSAMCVHMYMCVSGAWCTPPALTEFSVFKDMKWAGQNDCASDVQKRRRQCWQVLRVTNHKHSWLTVWRRDQAWHCCKGRKSVSICPSSGAFLGSLVGQGMATHTLIPAHVWLGQNYERGARLGLVACPRLAWTGQKRPSCLLLRLRV